MKLQELFQKTSAYWVRYNEYEYKEKDGALFILPVSKAKPSVYDSLKNADELVVDALNIGLLCMRQYPNEERIKTLVLDFAVKYGLLGFMTALPTTAEFMDYEAVYLPKNHFIKEETMSAQDYVALYFPFNKPDFYKDSKTAMWNVDGDRDLVALAMAFSNDPMAMNMSFQRDYAERVDWLATQFRDWAFTFVSSYLYYEDYDHIDEMTRDIYRQGMAAFGGVAPTYHIALYDKPTIVWDFHSLLLGVQMMFSFALVDSKKPLRACKHCTKIFTTGNPNAAFCSPECKNQHNVGKNRGKDK
jgi:hypothetical protein